MSHDDSTLSPDHSNDAPGSDARFPRSYADWEVYLDAHPEAELPRSPRPSPPVPRWPYAVFLAVTIAVPVAAGIVLLLRR